MTVELLTRVVRAHGSEKTHVVAAPAGAFDRYSWLGSPFVGIALPLATRCGVQLRGTTSAAVCMRAGTKVRCVQCRRLTGLTEAAEGNGDMPPRATQRPRPAAACAECGEPAVRRPPVGPWAEMAERLGRLPEWSHPSGDPLCPIVGAAGYVPCEPVMADPAATERED